MMRITNGMMMNTTKLNINNNKVSVDRLNTQMSTQKKDHKTLGQSADCNQIATAFHNTEPDQSVLHKQHQGCAVLDGCHGDSADKYERYF